MTKALIGLETRYYKLGQNLHIPNSKLSVIQHNNPRDCETALGQVIEQWLLMNYNHATFGPATWRLLVEAVDSMSHQLAKDIANNHQRYVCMCVLQCVCKDSLLCTNDIHSH